MAMLRIILVAILAAAASGAGQRRGIADEAKDKVEAFKSLIGRSVISAANTELDRIAKKLNLASPREKRLLLTILNAVPKEKISSIEATLLLPNTSDVAEKERGEEVIGDGPNRLTLGLTSQKVLGLENNMAVVSYSRINKSESVCMQKTFISDKEGAWTQLVAPKKSGIDKQP